MNAWYALWLLLKVHLNNLLLWQIFMEIIVCELFILFIIFLFCILNNAYCTHSKLLNIMLIYFKILIRIPYNFGLCSLFFNNVCRVFHGYNIWIDFIFNLLLIIKLLLWWLCCSIFWHKLIELINNLILIFFF